MKKEIVFRVKTFFNFTHQLGIEKDVKPRKKKCDLFVTAEERLSLVPAMPAQLTAVEVCSPIKSFLTASS